MKKMRTLIAVVLAGLLAVMASGCSSVSQSEQKEVVDFYRTFAKEATSLDPESIQSIYDELGEEDFGGQDSNKVRDLMFAKFETIDPDFFSKVHLTDSTYAEAGKTYATILLFSLATGGEGVEVTMPLDAVTSHKDDKLGVVYEIDRAKVTATVSESLADKVTRANRNGLAPVRIIKKDDSWKVLADNSMLTEIGVPLNEKISGPPSAGK